MRRRTDSDFWFLALGLALLTLGLVIVLPPNAPVSPVARIAIAVPQSTAPDQGYRRTLGLVLHLQSDRGPSASGFPVARVGKLAAVLTARHVEVDMTPQYGAWTAKTSDGRKLPVVAHEHSDDYDVAVAWVLGEVETVDLFGGSRVGDDVVSAGFLAPGFVVSEGMVGGPADWLHTTLMSALVYHGMSGGPVMLRDGRVVGLVNGYLLDYDRQEKVLGVSFFTPCERFESWLAQALTRVPEAPK